jgi:hypothetical protein
MANYVGKAPLTLVRADGKLAYVYAGEPVPQGVDPDDLKRLVDEEFFVKAADPEDPPPIEDPIAGHPFAPPLVDQFGVASAAASVPSGESGDVGVVVTPDGVEHVGELPASAARPAQAANKDAWVDFAVAQGADRAEAEAKTKAELIDAYGA